MAEEKRSRFHPWLLFPEEQTGWVRGCREQYPRALGFSVFCIGLLIGLTLLLPNVWHRMSAFYLLSVPVALATLDLRWRELLTPTARRIAVGIAAAVALYLLAGAGYRLLTAAFPGLISQSAALYAWREQLPAAITLPLLAVLIIPGEEIVWRAGVTLPLAGRFGPWRGCLFGALVFSAAHLAFGSPLLWAAAAGTGFFWNWLTIRARSLVPPLVCHFLWDVTVLYLLPY